MCYRMFVDDERFPPDDSHEWFICRTKTEVMNLIATKGFPLFVSFDHDLGTDEPTGYDIVKWMVELDMDHPIISTEFAFYVHSQNPIGARNIHEYLTSYLNHIRDES